MIAVAKKDHSNADCVLVAVSTHGDEQRTKLLSKTTTTRLARDIPDLETDAQISPTATQQVTTRICLSKNYIFGTLGKIFISDLMQPFSEENCPTLTGKPKIFIFQVGTVIIQSYYLEAVTT